MMIDILKRIVAYKKQEIKILKKEYPISTLVKSKNFKKKCLSAKRALRKENTSGIIAEFKRKSPSKGLLNENANISDIIPSYEEYGASMCSILTDSKFFGAKKNDFHLARNYCNLPLLRKEFIIDEYQIYETKAMGADGILLISATLSTEECKEFSRIAKSIGLEVLFEIHNDEELETIPPCVDIIGINNRNLKTFNVDTQKSIELAKKIPSNFLKIAESGINNYKDILLLKRHGFQGFLIGEHFMKSDNPGIVCKNLINKLNHEN